MAPAFTPDLVARREAAEAAVKRFIDGFSGVSCNTPMRHRMVLRTAVRKAVASYCRAPVSMTANASAFRVTDPAFRAADDYIDGRTVAPLSVQQRDAEIWTAVYYALQVLNEQYRKEQDNVAIDYDIDAVRREKRKSSEPKVWTFQVDGERFTFPVDLTRKQANALRTLSDADIDGMLKTLMGAGQFARFDKHDVTIKEISDLLETYCKESGLSG